MTKVMVTKVLPDGTRILSNGFRLMPSVVQKSDGSTKRLIDMEPDEYRDWNARLINELGKAMSERRS